MLHRIVWIALCGENKPQPKSGGDRQCVFPLDPVLLPFGAGIGLGNGRETGRQKEGYYEHMGKASWEGTERCTEGADEAVQATDSKLWSVGLIIGWT